MALPITVFVLLLALSGGIPVAFSMGLAGTAYLLLTNAYPSVLAAQLFGSLNSSGLLAIPFFVLAASVMSRGGATHRLIVMIDALFGHFKGGLPVVAVIAITCFSAICGSSVATAAAIGVVLIPEMRKRGYSVTLSVGLIATAGGLGILIPPSVPFILYGLVTEQSVAKLFMAGMVPGLVLASLLAAVAYILAARSGVKTPLPASFDTRKKAFKEAFAVVIMPFFVLGGIYGGFVIPTEAAAISAIYAILLTIFSYRVPLRKILPMLTESAATATMILFILIAAQLFSYVLTAERVPHKVFQYVVDLNVSQTQFLVITTIFFLIAGMFLEIISIILISMPIIGPILPKMGIDPIHFGVLLIINMELGVITPPIGLNLFVISGISKVPVTQVFRATLPYSITLLLFLLALTFIPGMGELIARIGSLS
jgi:C4-dicarboxylate transporter, DctM subunit